MMHKVSKAVSVGITPPQLTLRPLTLHLPTSSKNRARCMRPSRSHSFVVYIYICGPNDSTAGRSSLGRSDDQGECWVEKRIDALPLEQRFVVHHHRLRTLVVNTDSHPTQHRPRTHARTNAFSIHLPGQPPAPAQGIFCSHAREGGQVKASATQHVPFTYTQDT